MRLTFNSNTDPKIDSSDWTNWTWQLKNSLSTLQDFEKCLTLTEDERRFFDKKSPFQVRVTPYYMQLATTPAIRKILLPSQMEYQAFTQEMPDPLAETKNNPVSRIVHRYPDRALFLITDMCSVYCRFCTRKYFTGQEQSFIKSNEYEAALSYIKSKPQIREVILSGGDPLTISDQLLLKTLKDLRAIEHVEIIRIGSRMPVVCPMRITRELALGLREYAPVFFMTHFNHPKELTAEAGAALGLLVDHGIPVFNQSVLLNGVNNHPAIMQALSRRLLYLRVKPYYMFQCDPSMGSDHLRTSVEESLAIQRELWGRLSGLAMPNLSLDIPGGGGKVALVPEFETSHFGNKRTYCGFDGISGEYVNPCPTLHALPDDIADYAEEFELIKKKSL
ncbi:MAG: KamA family radical SAM protein [Pseudomonadota bacterium]|nr:KamA family radical SAM protein [Pseudomonadota bacterium]